MHKNCILILAVPETGLYKIFSWLLQPLCIAKPAFRNNHKNKLPGKPIHSFGQPFYSFVLRRFFLDDLYCYFVVESENKMILQFTNITN